jgi:hypothetical protein
VPLRRRDSPAVGVLGCSGPKVPSSRVAHHLHMPYARPGVCPLGARIAQRRWWVAYALLCAVCVQH